MMPVAGKARPHHRVYLDVLRGMTPEQRLAKAFDLSATARALFERGLRRRFPTMDEGAFEGSTRPASNT
jgi:hypothetical protein